VQNSHKDFMQPMNTDYVISCIPSCSGPENPVSHPEIYYSQSQSMAQGKIPAPH